MHHLFALLLALACLPGWAINKCRLPDGSTAFSDRPCPEAAKGERIRVTPTPAAPGAAQAAQTQLERDKWRAEVAAAISGRRILIGMTERELQEAIGLPELTNTDNIQGKVLKQLVYRQNTGTIYVYIREGVVSSVQDRPGATTKRREPEPCHSDREVANAFTAASSITLPEAQRREKLAIAREMRDCRR
jgi:hypothetical protein